MNGWMKWIITGMLLFFTYQNRYRLVNLVLANFFIRRLVVRFAMGIPSLRSRFIQSTFRA
ncbi:hypothetical protein [Bacillus seohaeanensis]|uniref:Uncharacterized protein n=1 Tax=Bacillus seohaeanensis TaxID=284580 RepID=A0ABW5RNM2_9BACI